MKTRFERLPAAAAIRLLRRRLEGERGSALVEILVTAAVGIVIGLAVYKGLDQASATYGGNRAKSTATGLAQQDQERLRAMKPAALSNLRETRTVPVASVNYTVVSRADWVSDASGTTSCTSGTARTDYMRVSSTVTWPAMGSARPITATSLVAAPAGSFSGSVGSLAVQINNAAGQGVPNINVSISGPASKSDPTNSIGCAFFGFIPAGNYNVTFSEPGYVNRLGVNAVTAPGSVVAGSLATLPLEYDRAGRVDVSFDTKLQSGAVVTTQGERLSASNSGLAAPRTFGSGTPASTISATNLFPFTSPYGFYSGNCTAADPGQYPGEPVPTVTVQPGGSYGAVAREPAINIVVKRTALGSPLENAEVTITPTGAGCTGTKVFRTDAQGTLGPEPGMPYGDFNVVARCGSRTASRSVSNNDADGTSTFVMTVGGSGGNVCP